jgi:hypothetical protein
MADSTTTVDPTDTAFVGLMDALVELIKSGVRPDVLEAQRLLLQRLATQGDVFPSRIPPPLNITQIGGYLNLLETAGLNDMRASAVASTLGIAGPSPAGEVLAGVVPVGFVSIANDRPVGPSQASIPPQLSIRADFHAPLLAALNTLHASGCALPLRAPRAVLPASAPGSAPSGIDVDIAMAALGRSLDVFPGTVLVDASIDPLAIARLETPATDPFRLVARVLDGSTTVTEASWVAMRASSSTVVSDAPALRRYVDVAPVLSAAGWNHPQPLTLPVTSTDRGSLTRFVNVTGLIAGDTTLGEELALLYPPAAIARSALSGVTGFVWDGSTFAPRRECRVSEATVRCRRFTHVLSLGPHENRAAHLCPHPLILRWNSRRCAIHLDASHLYGVDGVVEKIEPRFTRPRVTEQRPIHPDADCTPRRTPRTRSLRAHRADRRLRQRRR